MIKAILYPNLNTSQFSNPYIADFITSFEIEVGRIVNPKSKNPLFSIFFNRYDADVCFLHWIEDVPSYKYGFVQFFVVFFLLFRLKLKKCKIVWFLHNKHIHDSVPLLHSIMNRVLMKFLAYYSDIVITHSIEGIDYINTLCKKNKNKTFFLNHPTKNRLSCKTLGVKTFDFLIWGGISEYKQIREFLTYVKNNKCSYKIKIVGKCMSIAYYQELLELKNSNIEIENRGISFIELKSYIENARYVLIPYASASILSSGTLMDSLSYGAKVIGPRVGAFAELEKNVDVCVYTFNQFSDIDSILKCDNKIVDYDKYNDFLESNSWSQFMKEMLNILSA